MDRIEGTTDSVRPVKFKAGVKDELRKYLLSEVTETLNDRKGLEAKWKKWQLQANSRRKREDAGPRDSKLDMPLTRQRMVQFSSRLENAVFGQENVFTGRARAASQDAVRLAKDVEYILDEKVDELDFRNFCDEWIEQFLTYPIGVVKTPFVRETRKVMSWQPIEIDEYEMAKDEGMPVLRREMDDGSVGFFIETEGESVIREGCIPEVVPVEDFIFPVCASDIYSAEWVAHRVWLTKKQIKAWIRDGIYDEKDDNEKVIDRIGKAGKERERLIQLDGDDDDNADSPDPISKQYEVLEFYVSYDVDGDGYDEEIIVTIEKSSGTILRAIHNFYHEHYRPFITHCYKKVNGYIYGLPMTYFAEPLHAAYSGSVNQRLDTASKSNEKTIIVPPGSDLMRYFDKNRLEGGIYEGNVDKSQIVEIELTTGFSQLPQLEQMFEQALDRSMGFAGTSFGEEVAQRPTATGTTSLIEEAKQPQYAQLERFRSSLAQVARHILARTKQFYPEGLVVYDAIQDPQTGQETAQPRLVEWPDGSVEDQVLVEVTVTSAQMSKSARKQEIVALVDKIPQIYGFLGQLAGEASNPQNPAAMIFAKLLNGMNIAVDKMLTEFEVSEKGSLNPVLIQEAQVAQQTAQFIQQLQQMAQQAQQQVQQVTQQAQMAIAQKDQQIAFLTGGAPPGLPGQPGPPPNVQGPPPGSGPPPGAPGPQPPQ